MAGKFENLKMWQCENGSGRYATKEASDRGQIRKTRKRQTAGTGKGFRFGFCEQSEQVLNTAHG